MHRLKKTISGGTEARQHVPALTDVTAIIVNYRTPSETQACLSSLRGAYPKGLRLLVIDNGSGDESADVFRIIQETDPDFRLICNVENLFHGPALDQGMREAHTDFAFLLDSDCVVEHAGFMESMLARFAEEPLLYAIGKRGWTNRYGYFPVSSRQRSTPYVHPFAAMLDRRKYFDLPPFVHHGAPLYRNMWGARRIGFRVEHFTIEDYVTHLGKVTARKHGYGWNRRLEFQLRLHLLEQRFWKIASAIFRRPLTPPALPPDRTSRQEPGRVRKGVVDAEEPSNVRRFL